MNEVDLLNLAMNTMVEAAERLGANDGVINAVEDIADYIVEMYTE